MSKLKNDMEILRPLAQRYAELAGLDIQKERISRYFATNALQEVRPVVLIDEVPWGEIRDDFLVHRCETPETRTIEGRLRRALYQWDHFQVDMVIPPEFHVQKKFKSTGIGIEVQDTQIKGDTGAYISAHEYVDQLKDDDDLARLKEPRITYDRTATEKMAEAAEELFKGLLPVRVTGMPALSANIWDEISMFRGVDSLLMDLAIRPDFMHRTAERFTEIAEASFHQYIEQDLVDTRPYILHCTPACTSDLPAKDFSGTVRPKDVWGRCAAQIFAAVSPQMHDEFDLQYAQRLFGDCGLLYYGCCEPMDTKIDILQKRFPNLRKISITPWADKNRAADRIGRDYVLAGKPNPAFVNSPTYRPEPVEAEMVQYLEACRRNGTACEFVIKDISTIANRPENLTAWAQTMEKVIDRYY